jgi:hypothetical protein
MRVPSPTHPLLQRARIIVLLAALLTFGINAPVAAATNPQGPGTYKGLGFDVCQAPNQATMDAWRSKSPFRAIGIYISGNSRYCGDKYQPNLSAGWVQKNAKNGWRFMPIHVGYQSPCFKNNPKSRVQKKKMSSTISKARSQGHSDARETIGRLKKYGFGTGSVSYLDLEWYKRSSSCDAAVLNFMDAWTDTLHEAKYRSGVYSSGSAAIKLIDDAMASGKKFTRPDHVWIAWTNGKANTDGGPFMSSKRFTNHQRIHQYKNGSSVRYGGHTLTIDWNYLDTGGSSKPSGGSSDSGKSSTSEKIAKAAKGSTPKLKPGAKGEAVTRVQRALNATGRKFPVTGTFDAKTTDAVKSYRKAVGLKPKAKVTKKMWRALQAGKKG